MRVIILAACALLCMCGANSSPTTQSYDADLLDLLENVQLEAEGLNAAANSDIAAHRDVFSMFEFGVVLQNDLPAQTLSEDKAIEEHAQDYLQKQTTRKLARDALVATIETTLPSCTTQYHIKELMAAVAAAAARPEEVTTTAQNKILNILNHVAIQLKLMQRTGALDVEQTRSTVSSIVHVCSSAIVAAMNPTRYSPADYSKDPDEEDISAAVSSQIGEVQSAVLSMLSRVSALLQEESPVTLHYSLFTTYTIKLSTIDSEQEPEELEEPLLSAISQHRLRVTCPAFACLDYYYFTGVFVNCSFFHDLSPEALAWLVTNVNTSPCQVISLDYQMVALHLHGDTAASNSPIPILLSIPREPDDNDIEEEFVNAAEEIDETSSIIYRLVYTSPGSHVMKLSLTPMEAGKQFLVMTSRDRLPLLSTPELWIDYEILKPILGNSTFFVSDVNLSNNDVIAFGICELPGKWYNSELFLRKRLLTSKDLNGFECEDTYMTNYKLSVLQTGSYYNTGGYNETTTWIQDACHFSDIQLDAVIVACNNM